MWMNQREEEPDPVCDTRWWQRYVLVPADAAGPWVDSGHLSEELPVCSV